jgi:hypothetical protein
MGDPVALAGALIRLGSTLRWQGKFTESCPPVEEGLAIYSNRGFHDEPDAIISLATSKIDLGQYGDANALLQQGLDLAQEMNQPWTVGRALFGLGRLALVKKEFVEAQHRLEKCVTLWRAMGQQSNLGWPLGLLAGAARGLGQPCRGRQYLCQALHMAVGLRDALTTGIMLPFAALLLTDRGTVERSIEIYALTTCYYPGVAKSRAWRDIAGDEIAALAESLPPDVVAAAQERGQASDLWETVEELLVELESEE